MADSYALGLFAYNCTTLRPEGHVVRRVYRVYAVGWHKRVQSGGMSDRATFLQGERRRKDSGARDFHL